jgi:hypothetical protein
MIDAAKKPERERKNMIAREVGKYVELFPKINSLNEGEIKKEIESEKLRHKKFTDTGYIKRTNSKLNIKLMDYSKKLEEALAKIQLAQTQSGSSMNGDSSKTNTESHSPKSYELKDGVGAGSASAPHLDNTVIHNSKNGDETQTLDEKLKEIKKQLQKIHDEAVEADDSKGASKVKILLDQM